MPIASHSRNLTLFLPQVRTLKAEMKAGTGSKEAVDAAVTVLLDMKKKLAELQGTGDAAKDAPAKNGAAPAAEAAPAADGEQVVTPWDVSGGADGKIDYNKLVREFGCTVIDQDLIARVERLTGMHTFIVCISACLMPPPSAKIHDFSSSPILNVTLPSTPIRCSCPPLPPSRRVLRPP